MTAVQRSKSGCWTCRVRRKKCLQDGLPCGNCAQRGVFCHGYGPKPHWKDKGSLEKQEAMRLLHTSSRFQRRRASQEIGQTQDVQAPSPLPSATEAMMETTTSIGDFIDMPLSPLLDYSQHELCLGLALDELWPASSSCASTIPPAEPPAQATVFESNPPSLARGSWQNQDASINIQTVLSRSLLDQATNEPEAMDRGLDLFMRLLEQWRVARLLPESCRTWLLWLLLRSQVFLQCCLSETAYQESVISAPGSNDHHRAMADYKDYRRRATEAHSRLEGAPLAMVGEDVIAAVELARLEVLMQCHPLYLHFRY